MHLRVMISLVCAVWVAVAVACGSGDGAARPTSTPRPMPTPVAFSPEPQGVTLADPAFAALPGATAHYGRLGGTVYQIEMPDNWNGRLVLYMHGFQGLGQTARVEQPSIRDYLIRNGFAWGASSFSSTSLIPGRAADETAALWDLFVRQFSRPSQTYVTGHSMGGAATNIAAERYADRFDGALGLCGFAGQTAETNLVGDYFLAGAFVAGVTQAEFEKTDASQLIDARILPALNDSAAHQQFENILLDLTGGPRALDDEGFRREERSNWQRAGILVAARLVSNQGRVYQLGPLSSVSSDQFNRDVIRLSPDATRLQTFVAGNELTGNLQMPLLTLHTTGDWQVPIDQERVLRSKVEAAGRGDLLVQRVVKDPLHCGFTNAEWEHGLEDLTGWVERGIKPQGEDVFVKDLQQAGKFDLTPRIGTREADTVPGAAERVKLEGALTLDGAPLNAQNLGVVVRKGGLATDCSYDLGPASGGHYQRVVPGVSELRGCGEPGAAVYLYAEVDGKLLFSEQSADWPSSGSTLVLDAAFARAHPDGVNGPATLFFGDIFGPTGETPRPGTVIEAYAGETRCGSSSVAPVARVAFVTYVVLVGGPVSMPGCDQGAQITFRVDGKPVQQTATNDLQNDLHQQDLLTSPSAPAR